MLSSDPDLTAPVHRLPQHGGAHLRCSEERSTARARRRGRRTWRRGSGSVAVLLLLWFPAAASSQVVERSGAPRIQYHSGEAGDGEPEQAGLNECVWEVAGDWVRCFIWSAGPFIGRNVEEQGDQKIAVAGVLAAFEGRSVHGGLGFMLGRCWFGRGVLWVSSGASKLVGIVQGRGLLGGGPGCNTRFPSTSPGLGRGWGCWNRSRRGQGAWRQCWSKPAYCSSSEIYFILICCCQCSTKCPQEPKIWIFKIFHFGCSSYWIRYPVIFLFWRNNKFCKNSYFKFVKSLVQIQTLAQVWVML
jgi:hypothetical protein